MLTKTWYGDGCGMKSEVVQTRCASYCGVDVDGGGVGNTRDQVYLDCKKNNFAVEENSGQKRHV